MSGILEARAEASPGPGAGSWKEPKTPALLRGARSPGRAARAGAGREGGAPGRAGDGLWLPGTGRESRLGREGQMGAGREPTEQPCQALPGRWGNRGWSQSPLTCGLSLSRKQWALAARTWVQAQMLLPRGAGTFSKSQSSGAFSLLRNGATSTPKLTGVRGHGENRLPGPRVGRDQLLFNQVSADEAG